MDNVSWPPWPTCVRRRGAMLEGMAVDQHIEGKFNAQASGHGIASVNVYQTLSPPPINEETLSTAQARLNELPVDIIPPPMPLPQGSRVPLSSNPLFVGRERDLRALATA